MQRIQEATAALTRTKESSILDDAKTDLLDNLRGTGNKETKVDTGVNLDDIFGSYIKK
jgi:hypothetical protein